MLQRFQARFSPEEDPTYAAELRNIWANQFRVLQPGANIEKWYEDRDPLGVARKRWRVMADTVGYLGLTRCCQGSSGNAYLPCHDV